MLLQDAADPRADFDFSRASGLAYGVEADRKGSRRDRRDRDLHGRRPSLGGAFFMPLTPEERDEQEGRDERRGESGRAVPDHPAR